jgi:hypothetical protein
MGEPTIIPFRTISASPRVLLRILGDGVTVLMHVVDNIPSEPNGKFRPYRSYLNHGAIVHQTGIP